MFRIIQRNNCFNSSGDIMGVHPMYGLCIAYILMVTCVDGAQETVQTTSGSVRGKMVTFQSKNIYEYKMIPYAEPPTGELRFKPPIPKTPEQNTIDGTKEDFTICPQIIGWTQLTVGLIEGNRTIDEDCLYLDVYVPVSASSSNRLPVLFWIHGGGYLTGSGRFSSGRVLSSQYDIIVVTINYRLGMLGFLTLDDDSSTADLGLRDQNLALKWVNDNIESLGGDKSKITIAGESAGGSSVAQHTITELSKGLFQRAIIQSGGLDNPWACLPPQLSKSVTKIAAKNMTCTQSSKQEILNCLRTKTSEQILKSQGTTWAPLCSGGVLPYTIKELETSAMNSSIAKHLATLDILTGVNSQEGAFIRESLSNPTLGNVSDYEDGYISTMLAMYRWTQNQTQSLLPAIRFLYKDWTMPNDEIAKHKQMIDVGGDIFFIIGGIKYQRLHSKLMKAGHGSGSAYLYQLKPRPSWMEQKPERTGADHGDDLFFVFGDPLQYDLLAATEGEKTLSKNIMTYWSNFVKSGDPDSPVTSVDRDVLAQWPQYTHGREQYLGLDVGGNVLGEKMFARRVEFWIDYVPTELERLAMIKPPQPCPTSPIILTGGCTTSQATILSTILSAIVSYWVHSYICN